MTDLVKVLHVEDDPEILEISGMALTLVGGLDIVQVDRGEKALDVVADFNPQLVLSDMQMPGLTGAETIAAIRKMPQFQNIPCVFMTAKLLDGGESIMTHPQDIGLIPKPFDPMTLADELRALWNSQVQQAA
ncbi:MAG: response regulator [Rhodobacteraceae bacterium]|nr:response regulator [Paracoccaceae bacterium]